MQSRLYTERESRVLCRLAEIERTDALSQIRTSADRVRDLQAAARALSTQIDELLNSGVEPQGRLCSAGDALDQAAERLAEVEMEIEFEIDCMTGVINVGEVDRG